jgi:hypothetical protein
LYLALRYQRRGIYRTLLVIDTDLVEKSSHSVSYFVTEWRGSKESPSNATRLALEHKLAAAAQGDDGDVILYCPDANMQSKLIDARLEIEINKILPLRSQKGFVYRRDIETLQKYYESLWRAYIFVSPEIFESRFQCEAIVRRFCSECGVDWNAAKHKMRGHDFVEEETVVQRDLGFDETPALEADRIFASVKPFLALNSKDTEELEDYLVTFADRANNCGKAERNRIRNTLEAVLQSQTNAKARFNRPGLAEVKAEFERFLQPPGRNDGKTS